MHFFDKKFVPLQVTELKRLGSMSVGKPQADRFAKKKKTQLDIFIKKKKLNKSYFNWNENWMRTRNWSRRSITQKSDFSFKVHIRRSRNMTIIFFKKKWDFKKYILAKKKRSNRKKSYGVINEPKRIVTSLPITVRVPGSTKMYSGKTDRRSLTRTSAPYFFLKNIFVF